MLSDFIHHAVEESFYDFDNFKRKKLVARRVYEKRYENANDNHEIFEYEFKCTIEDADQDQDQAVYHEEGPDPDQAVFLNFARLSFQGNALLGFETNSLQVSVSILE